jgi:hypothetical protein
VFGQVEADIFGDGQGIEQRAGLEDHCEAILIENLGGLHRFAIEKDLAGIGLFQADDVLQKDGFAAATGSHQNKNFSRVHLEVDAFEDFMAIEALVQSADLHADTLLVGLSVIH